MRKIAILFTHELRILFADRQAIALLFVMPLAFIVFLTLALQDVYLAKVGKTVNLEVVSDVSCDVEKNVCTQLVAEMQRFQYQIRVVKTLDETHNFDMVLILPRKIEDTIAALKKGTKLLEEQQIQLRFDPTLDQSFRALVQSHLLLALQAVLIERFQEEMKVIAKGRVPVGKVANVSRFAGLVVERAFGGAVLPNPIQQTVPAWALFGMFFIVIPLSGSMIRDRRLGIFKRLLSFPVTRAHLLLGKVSAFLLINILQFCIMFAVGVFVLPRLTHLQLTLDFNLWSVFAVTVASALAATGYGLMVSCLANTPEQASAFGALSVVILAIIGGVMIPRFVMPGFMQDLAQFSPLYWGLDAYQDVIVRKAEFLVAAPKIGILLGFALVCGWISMRFFRWNEVY